MDVSNIKRPEDWGIDMPQFVRDDILALISAMERDDPNLDGYQDNLHGSLRALSDADDFMLHDYYLSGGYKTVKLASPYEVLSDEECMNRIYANGFMVPTDKGLQPVWGDDARRVAADLGEQLGVDAHLVANCCYFRHYGMLKEDWRQYYRTR